MQVENFFFPSITNDISNSLKVRDVKTGQFGPFKLDLFLSRQNWVGLSQTVNG